MITIENEYYLRSILLLCDGGSYITKKIIFRELSKRGGDLDALLKYEQFEKRVRNELRNKNQLDILFPTTGKTDVNTWDVQMLTGIIQILFWSDLETKERKHVKEIKRLRIVIAHSPSATLHEDEYRDFINDLAKAIKFLASKFEKAIQEKCTDCIKKYESCPLDVNSSIERLKELQYTDDQFRKILEEIEQSRANLSDNINDATSKICTDIAETRQTLSNQFQTFQAVLESVERMVKTEPLKRIRAIVKSRLTFSGDDEVDDLAEKMLLKVMNAAIKRAKDQSDPKKVRQAVDDIFEEIDKIAGVKILSAKSECIVIRIQCETYKGLYDVLIYVTSQTYHQRLSAIADALCSHLQTSKPLTLRSDLPQECLQNIAVEIGEAERAKRSIMLPIQCETKDGVENLLNLFESDVLSKKFHKLSEALSKELKGHVSVKAAVNDIYLKEDDEIGYIDTAEGNNTLYEKKHISFGNQSQSRNEGETISANAPSLEKKLVVAAIDIGTSFTAYAHSFESDFKRDHLKIYTYENWQNVMGIPTSKTPTVVLFDKGGQFHSFGYEAQIHYADLVEDEENCGWKYFSDLSLLRNRNQIYTLTDDQNHSMAALDVYSAILKYLKGHLLSNLADRLADLNETDVHWVLPVSAPWSLSERKLLADAAENACLSHESLTFVLKPEAAAIYCKEFLSSNVTEFRKTKCSTYFSPGAQFIVLDAGGQTVEVTTHEVQSDGTMMEILYSYVLSPVDGSWGGCLVDSKVNTFLEGLFGTDVMEEFRRIKIDVLELQHSTEMMKRQCKDPENEKEDFKIWLKVPATLLDIFKNANGYAFHKSVAESSYAMSVHAKGKKMYLSNDFVIEMYRESKEKLVRHLREIFRDNPELINVKTIIMTGGLANSEILKNEVRLSFPRKHAVVPDQADLAVVKGAVMCGFNTKMYLKM